MMRSIGKTSFLENVNIVKLSSWKKLGFWSLQTKIPSCFGCYPEPYNHLLAGQIHRRKKMGPKTQKLIEVLVELIALLEKHDVQNWSQWMQKALQRIENSDFSGITHLLGAYGGMGSFNDLILSFQEPQQANEIILEQDNEKLIHLRSKAYNLAKKIKREVDRS